MQLTSLLITALMAATSISATANSIYSRHKTSSFNATGALYNETGPRNSTGCDIDLYAECTFAAELILAGIIEEGLEENNPGLISKLEKNVTSGNGTCAQRSGCGLKPPKPRHHHRPTTATLPMASAGVSARRFEGERL